MDQLWAPWRLAYVAKPPQPEPSQKRDEGKCFICEGVLSSDRKDSLVLCSSELSIVVLNRYPYNNGHLLIAPSHHKATLGDLSENELLDLQLQLRKMISTIEKTMSPDGFNVGLNLGRAAGAGLPGHLHWHLVPRWNGDTNFMPIITDVKVIVQSLDSLHDLLSSALIDEKEV